MVLSAIVYFAISAASADANEQVENAFFLCHLIDNTGLSSAPCEVSGWSSTVTATIDMSSEEARKLCPQMAVLLRDIGKSFDGRWTLQIRSPYSNGNSIAYCKLP